MNLLRLLSREWKTWAYTCTSISIPSPAESGAGGLGIKNFDLFTLSLQLSL